MGQHNLGFMYFKGRGIAKDETQAFKWYRKSALKGFGPAQHSLGFMYEQGRGVAKDYLQAHMWFNLAASRETGERQKRYLNSRERVAKKMSFQQIVEAKKLATEWKPEKVAKRK